MARLQGTKLTDFDPVYKVTELQVIDTVIGMGVEVAEGSRVTVHYTGALCKDGTIFQSSHDAGEPVTFGLNQVIKGWAIGLPGMKVGGVRRIIIPSALGYGSARAASNIPPNSDLVFDIELIDMPKKWFE